MVKFERVEDPERAQPRDLLVLPAGNKRLSLAPDTLARYGLSVGRTCRAENSYQTLERWFRDGVGGEQRVFMVAATMHRSAPSEKTLLLGLDANAVHVPDKIQPVTSADLVPFGPAPFAGGDWTEGQWAAAWDAASGGKVINTLISSLGRDGCVSDDHGTSPDPWMTQVWDGFGHLIGADATEGGRMPDTEDWFPMVCGPGQEADESSYDLPSVMHWGVGWEEFSTRVRVREHFLTNMVRRGALLVRPNEDFAEAVTAGVAAWWMAEMHRRFDRRAAAGAIYLDALRKAVKADSARARRYASRAYKCSTAYHKSGAAAALARLGGGAS